METNGSYDGPCSKGCTKIQSKGGDCNKIYVTKLREIDLWLFHKEVTGSNPNIFKNVSDMIEDNPEALEATNEAALAQHTKEYNF